MSIKFNQGKNRKNLCYTSTERIMSMIQDYFKSAEKLTAIKGLSEISDFAWYNSLAVEKSLLPEPKGTEGVIWAHGLKHSNMSDPSENFTGILNIIKSQMNTEISCGKPSEVSFKSDFSEVIKNPLGPLGVYLQGTCTLLSPGDVGSILWRGIRYPKCTSKKAFSTEYSPEKSSSSSYSEAFVIPEKIVGVWIVKEYFDAISLRIQKAKQTGVASRIKFEERKLNPILKIINICKELGIEVSFV